MSNISRSVYAKVAEENKRLKKDIYLLTMIPLSFEAIQVKKNWQDKYEKDKEFAAMMKEIATTYFKEHPEHDIMNPDFKLD